MWITILNPKGCGGVQKCPVGFWLAAISHRIMLWSQKFLILSIYILSRHYHLQVQANSKKIVIFEFQKKWLLVGMFMDKVKNFCDHSMILWEMAANQKSKGTLWPTPASFRVKSFFVCISLLLWRSNATSISIFSVDMYHVFKM